MKTVVPARLVWCSLADDASLAGVRGRKPSLSGDGVCLALCDCTLARVQHKSAVVGSRKRMVEWEGLIGIFRGGIGRKG